MSKSERTRRWLIALTAVFTFTAGELAAHGHMVLFAAVLIVVALAWLAAAIALA